MCSNIVMVLYFCLILSFVFTLQFQKQLRSKRCNVQCDLYFMKMIMTKIRTVLTYTITDVEGIPLTRLLDYRIGWLLKIIARFWIFVEIEIKIKIRRLTSLPKGRSIFFFVLETIDATSWVSGNALSKSKSISFRFVWWSSCNVSILFPSFIWLWFTSVTIVFLELIHNNWERLSLFSSWSKDSKRGVT